VKVLTWEEVAKHNNSDDCWLVVDGGVYDVTSWISQHPGGDVIATLAGEDASAMIHGAHLIDLGNMLERYKIGQIDNYASSFTTQKDDFLTTLKHRVKQHFAENNIDYRKTSNSYADIIYTTALLLLCWYCIYFLPPWGILATIPMGLATCSLIGSFAHERVHGNLFSAISTRSLAARLLNNIAWGIFVPFMPERYFQYEHIKHHNHPMNPDEDYDVYALQYFLRLSPDTKWRKHHAAQHLYAPLVYSMYIFIQVVAGYITPFFDRRNILKDRGGLFDVSMMKLVAIAFHIALPVYLTSIWWVALCGSLYFLTWQAAIYITSGVPHMTGISHVAGKKESWSHYVCRTTVNLKCGNRFYDWLCGGLNYHLAHHLLPSIPREHLAEIMPIVKSTCSEYAYPCVCYDSFVKFYSDHYKFLISHGKHAQPDPALELK
jgi:fatty acid desaturase/predicted heme/steroid binding protein